MQQKKVIDVTQWHVDWNWKSKSSEIGHVTYQMTQYNKCWTNNMELWRKSQYAEYSNFYLVFWRCFFTAKFQFSQLNSNFQSKKSLWNIGHPNTSSWMHTDRYPDSIHKEIQKVISILNAFSVRLKLPHFPKIQLSTLRYKHAVSFAWEGHQGNHSMTQWLSPTYCLCFTSVTSGVSSVVLKGKSD